MTIEPGKGGWMFGFSLLMMPGLAEEGTGVKVKKEGATKMKGRKKTGGEVTDEGEDTGTVGQGERPEKPAAVSCHY